jgi:hypothetical protein
MVRRARQDMADERGNAGQMQESMQDGCSRQGKAYARGKAVARVKEVLLCEARQGRSEWQGRRDD